MILWLSDENRRADSIDFSFYVSNSVET